MKRRWLAPPWLVTLAFIGPGSLAVAAASCSSSGQPAVDPAAALAQAKAACAVINAIPAPPPPAATGGTGGVVTVATEAQGGEP